MSTPAAKAPPLGYFVSAYPAVSHTFISREIKLLRALGQRIRTCSINRPDRERAAMDAEERAEADATWCLKAAGAPAALGALLSALLTRPLALCALLAQGWRLGRGPKGLAYAIEALMVAGWMRREGLRHLHVHFGNVGAGIGVLVKAWNGCHLSLTVHGPDEFDDVPGQQLAWKMAAADVVICISQFARGQLMRISAPEHWPKFRVCRLGVDPTQFAFRLREPVTPTRLLCVGRLTPAKCQVLLVQACARLRDAGHDFRLTLVGAGPDRPRVEAAIAAAQLAERVTLTGALTQAQVRAAFDVADVFVLPSLAEGIPVVLMEAMSSGVPCVSTPVNGIPELIEHGRTGLLAIPGDLDSLVAQLARLIGDPPLRHALATAAVEKVRADFDIHRNVRALGAIFDGFPPSP